jgi:hypothetical protein
MTNLNGLSTFNKKEISLGVNLFPEENSYFYIKVDDDGSHNLNIPLSFSEHSKRDYNSCDYDIFFLLKKNVKESEVVRLCKPGDNATVGYLLPLLSMESNAHKHANDRSFLRYAFIAIQELLRRCDIIGLMKEVKTNQIDYALSDLLHDEVVICIIYKVMLNIGDFSRIAPVLFKYGYIKANSKKPSELQYRIKNEDELTKITLHQISSEIIEAPLIDKILHEQFPYEKNIAFKFFILYQIIELLMERVYNYFQNKIIAELILYKDNLSKSKEILGAVQDVSSEKRRLKLLFTHFITTFDNKNELKDACLGINQRMIDGEVKDTKDFVEYFYPIRNYIVHNYRKFPEHELHNLDIILDYFIDALPSMLSGYDESNLIDEI